VDAKATTVVTENDASRDLSTVIEFLLDQAAGNSMGPSCLPAPILAVVFATKNPNVRTQTKFFADARGIKIAPSRLKGASD
jgi:hypothetical protein